MGKYISYESKIKQQRGLGKGQNYIPWIQVGEKASPKYSGSKSRGNGHKILGLKTKRVHHLLTGYEKLIFMIFDLNPEINDIREQYPLLDLAKSKKIAKELGIKYPNPAPNHVLTSDFFLEYKNGIVQAITFKPLSNINARQRELFQIEKTYWEREGIMWKLMTEKDIPRDNIILKNYADLHNSVSSFVNGDFSIDQIQEFYSYILSSYNLSRNKGIIDFCNLADVDLGTESGLSLRILKVLLGRGIVHTKLQSDIDGTPKIKTVS